MKKNILLFILCNISISLFSQNKIQTKKSYYKSGKIKSELTFYQKSSKNIRDGKSSWWYETGELKNTQLFKKGKLHGERISYWKNGRIKRKDVFKKGRLKKGQCFNDKGHEIDYYEFEIHPEFPGGKIALHKLIKEKLLKGRKNVNGKLIFKFSIDTIGKPTTLVIRRDTNPSSVKELLNFFNSMPHWKPAYQDGIPVEVTRTLPVKFR